MEMLVDSLALAMEITRRLDSKLKSGTIMSDDKLFRIGKKAWDRFLRRRAAFD